MSIVVRSAGLGQNPLAHRVGGDVLGGGDRSLLPPACLVGLVVAAHLVLASAMRAPIVQADEFGYLYGAHFLALGGPSPTTPSCTTVCSASPYFPGYSLVLAPLWLVWKSTSRVYHAALDVNAALAGITAWLAYLLSGRLGPRPGPWARALIALLVCAYPSYLLFGNIVESENLLVPAWLGICLLGTRTFSRPHVLANWTALGLAGGLAYMIHPSALAVTAGVGMVGGWVALAPLDRPWPAARALRSVVALAAGLGSGLLVSVLVTALVSKGAPSTSTGFASAVARSLGLHGAAHLGVNTAGQLLYLLAVTGGLVVLAVPLLIGLLGKRTERGRRASAALITATSAIMGAVSVLSLSTGGAGRPDISIYGRYNEGLLAPILVVGGLALWRRRPSLLTLAGGLVGLGITAGAVVAARGSVLHGAIQASNILAAHALFRGSAPASLNLVLLAGAGAGVLVVIGLAARLGWIAAAVLVLASFVPSTVVGLGDLSTQSVNVAAEQAIPDALAAWGRESGCVAFDTRGGPPDAAFAYFDYRLYDPGQSFIPFNTSTGGRPCSAEIVSGRSDLGVVVPGARRVLSDATTGESLWLAPSRRTPAPRGRTAPKASKRRGAPQPAGEETLGARG